MDINQDLGDMKERIEVINRSNQFLKLMDEAVELMRKFHPQGERLYCALYYSYMSAYRAENIEEILDKLEPHFPKITRIHRATYFRGVSRHLRQLVGFYGVMKRKAEL